MADKRYAVYRGRNPGVYDSWAEARQQVDGYSGNCHEKVGSSGKAESKPYVVYEGAKPGVYDSWRSAHEQVSGHSGAQYERAKSFGDAADKWCDYKCSQRGSSTAPKKDYY